ncbi:sugar ABC transporter ATP-binding protein [Planococcus shenhongbingii]|uniref:Sugar ABC transporter ATP-binding protein n=1 Tax=Planococcus shenhongbingii TaxID=3058398 RepID=A0ABT8NEY6_9BACL|nr:MULTISPECIES: sugar ABC transporter ATP-binding protein [unclassified Planococcus (in: firmicutes)]MDN7246460.1 sugar ABC transporter ATP-binding protein [Planococcus sp. N017]WKA59451.1 sugar ABC transporter ATP-binding protein [Planococcus sp. N016]
MATHPFLLMKNIEKSFNGVPVLKGVTLQVEKGEIHALLGENGAGKSTLMNILGGVHQPDNGSLFIDGQEVNMLNPRVSQEQGISFIHQELNMVSDLRVYENMFLGSELRNKVGFLKVEEMCEKTHDIMTKLGVDVDPKEYVRNLATSYKQLIEISKALLHNSRLIIMDEPTTSLAEHEVNRLFELMKNLKQSGVSIIYISHKLKEIKEVCDRFTVLRDGERVKSGSVEEEDIETITKLMVGKSISQDRFIHEHQFGPVSLEVVNLTSPGLFRNINFTVKQGEVLGFTGLSGDGRTELFESLFGYRKKYTGEVRVHGRIVKIDHPRKAVKAGIGLVPKDRKENAIIKDLSVIHNMSLSSMGNFEKSGFIREQTEKAKFQKYKEMLNIKVHNPRITIDKLSGGNQQKVIIAKWLEVGADILIFDNPTQGIDVGAKQEIYHEITALAKMGKTVIILSSEAPEVLRICHNINVMYQGEITARFTGEEATEEEIMNYATGSKREAAKIG